jgi:hypothetical protein
MIQISARDYVLLLAWLRYQDRLLGELGRVLREPMKSQERHHG